MDSGRFRSDPLRQASASGEPALAQPTKGTSMTQRIGDRRTRRDVLRIMAGTGAATVLAACGAAGTAPGSSGSTAPAPAGAQPSDAGPVGGTPSGLTHVIQPLPTRDFGFLPTIVAASKGFFADEGLSVDTPVMAPTASNAAITNKEIQFASSGSGIRAAYQGAPLRGVYYSWHGCNLIAVGGAGVDSYRDLKGKLAAVNGIGDSTHLVLNIVLESERIPPEDVSVIALGSAAARSQAITGGQVQFALFNADQAIKLESQGFKILGAARELLPIPWSGYITHEDTIRNEPNLVKGWLRAHVRALTLIKQNPAEAQDIAVQELQLTADVARRALELVIPAIDDDDPGGATEAAMTLLARQDLAMMNAPGDPAAIAKQVHDFSLLRQAQRELGIVCTRGYACA
jgi:NitT/TauT family transport system substrate-binding protein